MKLQSILKLSLAGTALFCVNCARNDMTEITGDDTEQLQQDLSLDNRPGMNSPYLYDSGTACSSVYSTAQLRAYMPGTHCCPSGMAMTGAHIGRNIFKCAVVSGGFSEVAIDLPSCGSSFTCTQRNGMHACPLGWVMVGFNNNLNVLVCGRPASPMDGSEYVDGGTQDKVVPMHICEETPDNPHKYAMSGIHVSGNRFTCVQ